MNLAVAGDLLKLDVSDNGRGFAPVNGGALGRTVVVEGTRRSRARLAHAGVAAGTHRRFDQSSACRSGRMTDVLLADDHPMIASALEMLLRGTDYQSRRPRADRQGSPGPDRRGEAGSRAARRQHARRLRHRRASQAAQGRRGAADHPAHGRSRRSAVDRRRRSRAERDRPQDLGPGASARMHGPGARRQDLGRSRDRRSDRGRQAAGLVASAADPARTRARRAGSAGSAQPRNRRQARRHRRDGEGLSSLDLRQGRSWQPDRAREGTVKVYLHSIFDKLEVTTRTELAIRASTFIGP